MKKTIGTILTVITVSILLSGCSKAKYPIIHFTQKEFVADGNGVVEIKGQFLNGEPGTLEANINRKAKQAKLKSIKIRIFIFDTKWIPLKIQIFI